MSDPVAAWASRPIPPPDVSESSRLRPGDRLILVGIHNVAYTVLSSWSFEYGEPYELVCLLWRANGQDLNVKVTTASSYIKISKLRVGQTHKLSAQEKKLYAPIMTHAVPNSVFFRCLREVKAREFKWLKYRYVRADS